MSCRIPDLGVTIVLQKGEAVHNLQPLLMCLCMSRRNTFWDPERSGARGIQGLIAHGPGILYLYRFEK